MGSRERLYLGLSILGLIVPPALLGVWIADNGFDLGGMLDAAVDNTVALAVLCDVSIASLVFWSWMADEAPKAGVSKWGWLIVANVLIGLCFALPYFLFRRERALRLGTAQPAPA